MRARTLAWPAAVVVVALLVAYQACTSAWRHRADAFVAADIPTLQPGADILDGIPVIPARHRSADYRRSAFGESWTDETDAPGGHNGCDTRNDILDRDLVDKTYLSIKRCPNAVATGTLHDPYTNAVVALVRGEQTGASVQIDHIVPLAMAWDLGARNWTEAMRVRFANDPRGVTRGRRTGKPGQKRPGSG